MKKCPRCGVTLSDQQNICPSCGGDYLQLSIQNIAGSENMETVEHIASANTVETENASMLLQYMSAALSNVINPVFRDYLVKMSREVVSGVVALNTGAGISTGEPIFLGIAVAAAGVGVYAGVKKKRRGSAGGRKDAVLTATTNIFEENAKIIREKNGDNKEIIKQLDSLQTRLNEVKAAHKQKEREHKRKLWFIMAVYIAVVIAIAIPLTINNIKTKKAEMEYAQLPDWVKVRDNFINSEYNDEYGDNSARIYVLNEILNAGEFAAAESFFFDYCMGNVGDFDCAKVIVERYRKAGNTTAVEAFKQRLSLRYDSDTKKAQQL